MYSAETQIRVRYAETDQMSIVYHGNYFQYFEVARAEAIRKLGFTYADIEDMGFLMPVADVTAKFLRPVIYDQLITVKAIIKDYLNDERIEFHHEVYSAEKQLLATGRVALVFLEANSMKKVAMPFVLKKKIQKYFKPETP
jgi:acyl-CoA thioester hydrolase